MPFPWWFSFVLVINYRINVNTDLPVICRYILQGVETFYPLRRFWDFALAALTIITAIGTEKSLCGGRDICWLGQLSFKS